MLMTIARTLLRATGDFRVSAREALAERERLWVDAGHYGASIVIPLQL